MKIRFMQLVDYWVGIPICFTLSIFDRCLKLLGTRKSFQKPEKIMLIELSEMGSAIIAYSAIEKAKELVDSQNLFFLIFKKNRESVDILGSIPEENIITINDRNFLVFCFSLISQIIRIRSLKIDTTVDLETFSRCTAIISYLSGARNRAGFYNYSEEGLYRGKLLTHPVFYNNLQHMAKNFLSLVRCLFPDNQEEPILKENVEKYLKDLPALSEDPVLAVKIKDVLEKDGIRKSANTKLILINPDPGLLTLRGWAIANFAELITELNLKQDNLIFAVIGLERTRYLFEELKSLSKASNLYDLTGKTDNIKELVQLFMQADLLITTDGGPAHMAALTKIKIITLFGPESPLRYAPLSPGSLTIFKELSCSPCYSAANHRHSVCTNNICMQSISVNEVRDLALLQLK